MALRIAITGATGFIGEKLVLRHVAAGDQVRVLSRRPREASSLSRSTTWFQGDLANPGKLGEQSDLARFVDHVDVLYHCAAELNDTVQMQAVNVQGTQRLLAAASGRIGRWVQLSSTGAYGPQRLGEVTELTRVNPVNAYERSKVGADQLVQSRASVTSASNELEYVVLRPSNVYGANMANQSLFSLIAMVRRGLFFYIGQAGASANYIHVDNVVEALVLCSKLPQAKGQVFNISQFATLEDFISIVAKLLGKPEPKLRIPEFPVRMGVRIVEKLPSLSRRLPLTTARIDALTARVRYSTEKIERVLGYCPVVTNYSGLRELAHRGGKKSVTHVD